MVIQLSLGTWIVYVYEYRLSLFDHFSIVVVASKVRLGSIEKLGHDRLEYRGIRFEISSRLNRLIGLTSHLPPTRDPNGSKPPEARRCDDRRWTQQDIYPKGAVHFAYFHPHLPILKNYSL
jgi:hypothetical protein